MEINLEELEQMAGLFFSIKELAVILQVDYEDLQNEISRESGGIYLSYMKGKLKAEAELRKSIFDIAKQGSSPAQTAAMDIIRKNRMDD